MKFLLSTAALTASIVLATPAQAATFVFVTNLTNVGEAVPTSTATGNATVTFNDVAGTVAVQLNWAGLANSSPFGHIHCCTAAPGIGNASVLLDFGTLTATATGSFSNVYTPVAATFTSLLAGVQAGRAYVNIHTPGTYQGGEIRGFLAPIPEPETYALLLAGLAVVGGVTRRQRSGAAKNAA